jgi:hypothetical protein
MKNGQSRDETLPTFGTQDTGRRQTKETKKNKTRNRKIKG